MKVFITVLLLLSSSYCYSGEYSDCILENMKGVGTPSAAYQVRLACKEKVLPYVPAKCLHKNDKNNTMPATENPFDTSDRMDALDRLLSKGREDCINSCLNASYWSKHFGDCKE